MEEEVCLSQQGEEATPLLRNEKYEDGASDTGVGGTPSIEDQCIDRRAPAIILGFECLESLGYFGVSTNLVIYLSSVLHESNASIATSVTMWTGTSFLTPFFGALLADSYCGSYWMIVVSSLMDLSGMVLITLSASFPSPTSTPQKIMFYSGLYLVAFGSGGIKSSLIPLGADQFGDENPKEREKKASFFNWFYFCVNVGCLTSSTLIVWVQENVGWVPGFGIAALCMAVAVGAFICGTNTYKLQMPKGSPVKRVLQFVVASLGKMNSDLPSDSSLLYEKRDISGVERLEHTGDFRFLDKAAVVLDSDAKDNTHQSWRICTVTQVEELKILLRLLPIWLTSIAYSIAYTQMYTTFIEQAKATDTTIGSFHVPPASLYAFEVLCTMFWVLIYNMGIAPAARAFFRNERGLSQLQRMGFGYFLMVLTMATAALVEVKRMDGVRAGEPISIAWLLPQYFLVGASEVFTFVGQTEFFYGEGPHNMRNLCTSLSSLAFALANYLSSLMLAAVAAVTGTGGSKGWIPDDLNEGHLDYFFWVLAGLCSVNLLAHFACARRYTPKRTVVEAL